MTAHLFAEAVDTLLTLCRALSVWIVLLSVVATCAAYTVVVAVAWPCRAAREGVAGALAASRALRALRVQPERYRPRVRPLWAAA